MLWTKFETKTKTKKTKPKLRDALDQILVGILPTSLLKARYYTPLLLVVGRGNGLSKVVTDHGMTDAEAVHLVDYAVTAIKTFIKDYLDQVCCHCQV